MATDKSVECLNCGAAVAGAYCSHCGQAADVARMSVRLVLGDFLANTIGADGRTPSTLRGLFMNPGRVAREYVEGKRRRYIGPFRFAFFTSALWFIALNISFALSADDVTDAQRRFANYGQAMNLALMPLMALCMWIAFLGAGYRLVEYLTLTLFVSGLAFLWRGPLVLWGQSLGELLGVSAMAISSAEGLLFLGYLCYGMWTFNRGRLGRSRRVLGIFLVFVGTNIISVAATLGFRAVAGDPTAPAIAEELGPREPTLNPNPVAED